MLTLSRKCLGALGERGISPNKYPPLWITQGWFVFGFVFVFLILPV